MEKDRLTPNQVVAWNLARARRMRGWTQEQAATRLEPYLGERWSKATYSAAERSVDGTRIRQFTADDLLAFSRAFDLPMTLFLTPPPQADAYGGVGHAAGGDTASRLDYLDSIFGLPDDARLYLIGDRERPGEIVEFSAPATQMLHRWAANFAAMADQRQREVDAFLNMREEA